MSYFAEACGSKCNVYVENYLAWEAPGIGRGIAFLLLHGLLFFFLIILMESSILYYIWQTLNCSWRHPKQYVNNIELISMGAAFCRPITDDDDDVIAECHRISATPLSRLITSEALILLKTQKYYGDLLAVKELSLGISQGECFGLLGVNGAGKTTTFKMLTGDEALSSGDAYLCGHSVKEDITNVSNFLVLVST